MPSARETVAAWAARAGQHRGRGREQNASTGTLGGRCTKGAGAGALAQRRCAINLSTPLRWRGRTRKGRAVPGGPTYLPGRGARLGSTCQIHHDAVCYLPPSRFAANILTRVLQRPSRTVLFAGTLPAVGLLACYARTSPPPACATWPGDLYLPLGGPSLVWTTFFCWTFIHTDIAVAPTTLALSLHSLARRTSPLLHW